MLSNIQLANNFIGSFGLGASVGNVNLYIPYTNTNSKGCLITQIHFSSASNCVFRLGICDNASNFVLNTGGTFLPANELSQLGSSGTLLHESQAAFPSMSLLYAIDLLANTPLILNFDNFILPANSGKFDGINYNSPGNLIITTTTTNIATKCNIMISEPK